MGFQVRTSDILTDEQVKELEKKVKFWENNVFALVGMCGVIPLAYVGTLIQNQEIGLVVAIGGSLLFAYFGALHPIFIANKIRDRLAMHRNSINKIKEEQARKYLAKHPELVEVAEQKYIKQQAHFKVLSTVRNLITIDGEIDESAVLTALQK